MPTIKILHKSLFVKPLHSSGRLVTLHLPLAGVPGKGGRCQWSLTRVRLNLPGTTHRQLRIGRKAKAVVSGDAERLRRLLSNLVDNAIRYTREGDTITISLDTANGQAYLEVADTGIGIEPEHLPHILERFYRVDRARSRQSGGSGLGLAIVKEIAEQHGGEVTVASQPGKGSRFTVRLPLRSEPG